MCLDCGPHPGSVARRTIREASPRRRLTAAPVDVTEGLSIFPRSTWAGDQLPPRGELYPEQVRFLLVHHSAGPSEYTEDEALAEMQNVYSFHTGPDRGWPDVCYNFFIDRFGRVFEAREGSLNGAVMADATGGSQGFAQLVCLLGDFTDSLPTPETLDALTKTLAWLAGRHQLVVGPDAATTFVSRGSNRWPEGSEVLTNTIAGHRDMSQTACPGDAFYPYVTSTLRVDVAARVAASPPVAAVADPTTAGTALPADSAPPSTSAPASTAPSNTAIATPPVVSQTGPTASVVTSIAGQAPSVVTTTPPPGATDSGTSDVAVRTVAGVGVVGLAAGLGWVIKRRMENDNQSDE